MRIGNSEVGPGTDFRQLLRRQLTGGAPLSGRLQESPEEGALSLFQAIKGTPLVGPAAAAVLDLLTDQNLDVRAGAVAVVEDNPQYFDSSRLFALLENSGQLFKGVGANHFGRNQPDLAWPLLRAMAAAPNPDGELRQELRRAVQDPTNGRWVLAGVTANDPEWVLAHPAEAVQADATRAWIVILNLGRIDRERLMKAASKDSSGFRSAIQLGIDRAIRDPVERNRLRSLLDQPSAS